MDNKLIELSKPVAYDYQVAGACIADGHNENGKWVDWDNKLSRYCPPDWMVEEGKVTGLKLLYSQEYVSALLAELEFEKQNNAGVAGMVEDYETKLEAKDKRIAELERTNQSQDDHINQQQDRIDSLEKKNGDLGRSLGAAEKRLATPVRLPNKNDDEFWFDGVFQVAKFDRAVERAVSAAGFKFVGDE
ncbi:hypothetical protein [Serratia nevei]|uniref:hypothetical protein n=1 Tax=Serratia nevei TaxID=2703794 RepID=UPI00313E3AD4